MTARVGATAKTRDYSQWDRRCGPSSGSAAYLAVTLAMLPVQAFAVRFNRKLSISLPLLYHRLCVRILGFQIRTHGEMAATAPVLFACNHTSYSDISILGALLPASFVAKAEVASWPFFGGLAKLQRTVFCRSPARRRRQSSATKWSGGLRTATI